MNLLQEIYKDLPKLDNSLFEQYLNSEIGSKLTLDSSKSAINYSHLSLNKLKDMKSINSLKNMLDVNSPIK